MIHSLTINDNKYKYKSDPSNTWRTILVQLNVVAHLQSISPSVYQFIMSSKLFLKTWQMYTRTSFGIDSTMHNYMKKRKLQNQASSYNFYWFRKEPN